MIALNCPACQKKLSVKDELAGKKIKCPGCGTLVLVAETTAATVAAKSVAGEERTLPPRTPVRDEATLPPKTKNQAASDSLSDSDNATRPNAASSSLNSPELTDFLAPAQQADEIGRLGPFRVLKVLGAGGMGVVYKAEDPQLKRLVALKAMLPTLGASESARRRFLREAQSAAAIVHDHIVPIHQVGEDRSIPFVAMQFLEGEPLDERLKREGCMAIGEVLRIGRETAEGLAAAHDKGLIHRDIKPANIWLEGKKGRVKILDFGLARAAADDSHLTQTGAILGTPAYMAPEQAAGEKVDARCDLFSLGCVLYRMCTGEFPFKGKDSISTLVAVATENPAAPDEINPEVPADLSDLVMKLLAKKPGERSKSAHEVVEALQGIDPKTVELPARSLLKTKAQKGQDRGKTEMAPGPKPVKKKRLPVAWVIGGGVVGLILLATVIVVFWRSPHGLVRIESDDPNVEIVFMKDGPTIKGVGKDPISIRSGEYSLLIKRGDFQFETNKLYISKGKTVTLKIELLAGKVQVTADGRVIGEKASKEKRLASALRFRAGDHVEIPSLTLDRSAPWTMEGYFTPAQASYPDSIKDAPARITYAMGVKFQTTLHIREDKNAWSVGLSTPKGPFYSTAPFAIVKDRRTHVAGVRLGKEYRLFIDGKLVSKVEVDAPMVEGKNPFRLGGDVFAGLISSVRVSKSARYDKDFTPAQRFEPDADTLALYLFDEGAGSVLKDSSGNGHDGKIIGAKWVNADGSLSPAYTNSLGMEFVLVPKGTSLMGGGDGKPGVKEVPIKHDFYLGVYEVTQEQWENIMGSNPSAFSRKGSNRESVRDVSDAELKRFPVDSVSWYDVQAFLVKLNKRVQEPGWTYRLPTEAEWEYACRGGPPRDTLDGAYDYYLEKPANHLLGDQANFNHGQDLRRPRKVGSYKPNRLGLFDMHGNVWEWCDDTFDNKRPERATRGGCWANPASSCRTANRLGTAPTDRLDGQGLRLARVPVDKEIVKEKHIAEAGITDYSEVHQVDEKRFDAWIVQMKKEGLYPVSLNIMTVNDTPLYTAVAVQGQNKKIWEFTRAALDDPKRVSLFDKNYRYIAQCLYVTKGKSRLWEAFLWVWGPNSAFKWGWTANGPTVESKIEDARKRKERPVQRSAVVLNGGDIMYNVVFADDRGIPWLDSVDQSFEECKSWIDKHKGQGWRPEHLYAYGNGPKTLFGNILIQAPGPDWDVSWALTPAQYDAELAQRKRQGFRPHSPVAHESENGDLRFSTMWVRYRTGEAPEKWVQLFNGRDLTGWKLHPGVAPGKWSVDKGVLRYQADKKGDKGGVGLLLVSERGDYRDVHLRLECNRGHGNGGLRIRVAPESLTWSGYFASIAHAHPEVAIGSLAIGPKNSILLADPKVPPNTWYTLEMIAQGNRYTIKVNGKVTAEYDDPDGKWRQGHIVLSPGAQWPPTFSFKKIEVLELPPAVPDELSLDFVLKPGGTGWLGNRAGFKMDFVTVPMGKAWLGGGGNKPGDQEVEFKRDFYMATYPVTQEQWQQIMGNNPSVHSRHGGEKNQVKDISDDVLKRFPVEMVNWFDCSVFVERLNELARDTRYVYRLPTDEEWEYACRGGPMTDKSVSAFDFYFDKPSNDLMPEQANFNRAIGRPCKVGNYKPNTLGLYDMHGNVGQWISNGAEYASKGAGWVFEAAEARAANRRPAAPGHRAGDLGLRIVRVPFVKTAAPADRIAYLSDLPEFDWKGHGVFGKNGKVSDPKDGTTPIWVQGKKFAKGLWMHPPGESQASIKYRLKGLNAHLLKARVAINDSADNAGSTLTFQVLGDGKILWTSKPIQASRMPQDCVADVKGVKELELRVLCPGAAFGAHAVWLDPYLSSGDAAPIAPPDGKDYALKFDGKTSYVEIPTLSRSENGPITVEGYVTPNSAALSGYVLRLGGLFPVNLLRVQDRWQAVAVTGKVVPKDRTYFDVKSGKGTATPNNRVHLALVYDGQQCSVYVNGKRFQGSPGYSKVNPTQAPTVLGARRAGNNSIVENFDGIIDELRISKAARYGVDFTPQKRFEPDKDTIALYHFDEGAGNVLKDSSGNKHDGKIVGATWVKADGSPIVAFTNSLGMEFVLVPKGKSWLGGGGGKPGTQEAEIKHDFYLGKYEVTQEEWRKIMGDEGKDALKEDQKRLPVASVSWEDAQRFIKSLNEKSKETGWVYRLPREIEWEYACRGGPMTDKGDSAFDYYFAKPTNQLLPEQANFAGDKAAGWTLKVGSYPPNRLGLHDMHGNVGEWCEDSEKAGDGPVRRVYRGGGWSSVAEPASSRHAILAREARDNIGLRLARVPVGKEIVNQAGKK